MPKTTVLTVYQGRAGDHNDLAIPGAASIGRILSERLGAKPIIIGEPEPALSIDWKHELAHAMPSLRAMAAHYDSVLGKGLVPITASSRCAVSLSTLPPIARHRPDACVIWFDSHPDLNTPETTTTGYLGGLSLSGPAGLWDSGLGSGLSLSNVILVGERDIDPSEQALIDAGIVLLVSAQVGFENKLRTAIAGRPVYVHWDCDVLSPGIVPTDYQHEGGLTLSDLFNACVAMTQSEIVGFEIAEFENAWEVNGEAVSPVPLLDALQPLIENIVEGTTQN